MDDDPEVWARLGRRIDLLAADLTDDGFWEVKVRWDRPHGFVSISISPRPPED